MSEIRTDEFPAAHAPAGGRTSWAVVGLSLLLVAAGFVAGVFATRAFAQPAVAAVVRPKPGTLPRPGFNPGGPLRPGSGFPGAGGGQSSGGVRPGTNLPSLPGNGSVAFGTIASVNGNTVTVKTVAGQTVTVQVGAGTVIRVVKNGSVGDLTAGSRILVVGTRTSGGALQARMINAGDALPGGFRAPIGGSSSSGLGVWPSNS